MHPKVRDHLDDALRATMALKSVQDLVMSCTDLHVVDPNHLSSLLGMLNEDLETHLEASFKILQETSRHFEIVK